MVSAPATFCAFCTFFLKNWDQQYRLDKTIYVNEI